MSASPTVAVTGASGLIGSRLVSRLVEAGATVHVLTRHPWTGDERVRVFQGDLSNAAVVKDFLKGASQVFHCAAELHDRSRMWQTNVDGTAQLFEGSVDARVGVFCLMSSVGVIGRTDNAAVTEETPCDPVNDYERSKLAAEQVVMQSGGPASVVIVRPTNVVAPNRPGAIAIALRARAADRLKVLVQGRECVHVVDVDNVVAAALHAAAGPSATYIVSSDDDSRNSLAGLWQMIHGRSMPTLPMAVPHAARRWLRGRSNRGDVKYSSDRLRASGFMFPKTFEATVTDVVRAWRGSR